MAIWIFEKGIESYTDVLLDGKKSIIVDVVAFEESLGDGFQKNWFFQMEQK